MVDQDWIWEKIVLQVRMRVQEALSEPAGWGCAGRTTSVLNEYMGGVISTGFTNVRGTAPFSLGTRSLKCMSWGDFKFENRGYWEGEAVSVQAEESGLDAQHLL